MGFVPRIQRRYASQSRHRDHNVPLPGVDAANVSIQRIGNGVDIQYANGGYVAGVVDWQFKPKWDTYVGAWFSEVNGGLASGFAVRSMVAYTGGVRLRF